MSEQVVFDETIENLLRPYKKRLPPSCVQKLRAVGVDIEQKLKPKYARQVHDEVIRVLAEEFHGGLPMEEASYNVGRDTIRVVEESIMGKTLMRMLRLLPFQASIKRLPVIMRIGNNYIDVTVTVTGPKAYVLDINEVGKWPQYWVGLMGTANKLLLGYERSTIALNSYDGHRGVIAIDLEPP